MCLDEDYGIDELSVQCRLLNAIYLQNYKVVTLHTLFAHS